MNCKNCNNNKYYAKPSSRRIGLYCTNCNTLIRWITYPEICELYKSKDEQGLNDKEALKRIFKRSGITTMRCSKCNCLLYNSSKPKVQYRFDLVNAKFCPECGRKFIL